MTIPTRRALTIERIMTTVAIGILFAVAAHAIREADSLRAEARLLRVWPALRAIETDGFPPSTSEIDLRLSIDDHDVYQLVAPCGHGIRIPIDSLTERKR